MGIFSTPIIGDLMDGIFGIFDDVHTSSEEKAEIRLKLMQVGMSADLAQTAVNKEEAKSGILFVAGWRPWIGWVCGCAFAYNYVIAPFLMAGVYYYGQMTGNTIDMSGLPTLDLAAMIPVLMGMLGLGGLRTYEKREGIARAELTAAKPVQINIPDQGGLVD
jgi:hypothetical protein